MISNLLSSPFFWEAIAQAPKDTLQTEAQDWFWVYCNYTGI